MSFDNFNTRPTIFFLRLLSVSVPFFLCHSGFAIEIDNLKQLRDSVGLTQVKTKPSALSNIRIAVLDNGFSGFTAGNGELPDCTKIIQGPGIAEKLTPHGLLMAKTLWNMTGQTDPSICAPEITLVNAHGYTNLVAAIDWVIENQIDIVVYAINWEYGGNFDGKGFINKEVNRAIDAGVMWINAAGDYQGLVYEDQISVGSNFGLEFTPENNRGRKKDTIRFKNNLDNNDIKVVLSWNDFSESESYATTDDLDIKIYDGDGNEVASGERIQSGSQDESDESENYSQHAREIVFLRNAKRDEYFITIDQMSSTIMASKFRITLVPDTYGSMEWLDKRVKGQVMIPADNPKVIAVGDTSPVSASGATSDGRLKPDILMPISRVEFSDGTKPFGTSFGAAIFGGIAAVMKSIDYSLTQEKLIEHLAHLKVSSRESSTGALQITAFNEVQSALGITRLAFINSETTQFAKIQHPITGQMIYYALIDSEPNVVEPFIRLPGVGLTNSSTHVYLMNRFRNLYDFRGNDSRYGAEYLRILNINSVQITNPNKKDGVPVWSTPRGGIIRR